MIKKFEKIINIASYSHFKWEEINPYHGDNPSNPIDVFKKDNVIFAENGYGKSILVNIYKSLDGQEVELEKNRDRLTDEQEINIILADDSDIQFTNSEWSSGNLKDKFVIFDEYFIEKFVHSIGPDSNDPPQRRQQRGRNIVYLGNFAEYDKLVDRINTLKNNISEKNREFLQSVEAQITGLLNKQEITTKYLTDNRETIEKLGKETLQSKRELIIKNNNELEKIDKALQEKNKISSLSLLSETKEAFSLKTKIIDQDKEEVTIDPPKLFSFTIAKGFQQTLEKIYHKKDFIKKGLSFLTSEKFYCPFCEQKIKNGEYIQIIKDYQEIFDDPFEEEEKNILSMLSEYKNILENLKDLQPPSTNINNYNQAKPFISTDIELPNLIISDSEKLLIKDEIVLVQKKEKMPLEKMIDSNIQQIKKIIIDTNLQIESYNKTIKEINKEILQLKKDMVEGKLDIKKAAIQQEINKLRGEIFFIENKEEIKSYFESLDESKKNEEVTESLERIYQKSKDQVLYRFETFVKNYFEQINIFIKKISPSMELFDISGQPSYDRRNPHDPAQCGFCVKYNNIECTGSLSKGEKQVIALSFFFAQLRKEEDRNKKEKIIVLDDPITSFDAGKRKSTAELIQSETRDFCQLFIFTCDPLFREYCLKQFENRNFYYIFKTKGFSSIHYVPKNRETIYTSFETDFRDIDNINGSNENVIIYGQKLRFCLETKIKEDYFGFSEDNLSSMIKKVTSKNKKEFEKIFDNKETILQIYNYCNTGGLAHYPKDGSTSWEELKYKIKQYLNMEL